jgi:hypothetical protein
LQWRLALRNRYNGNGNGNGNSRCAELADATMLSGWPPDLGRTHTRDKPISKLQRRRSRKQYAAKPSCVDFNHQISPAADRLGGDLAARCRGNHAWESQE